MEFEVIRKSHKKEIIIGISLFVILAIALVVRLTFAKYNLVKSIKIAEGTINYKVPDFKIMAMYKNDGSGYTEIDTMPESGYAINETKSYCELNGNKDSNARVYSDEELHHIISNITKGSKCYLYFDNYRKVNTSLGEITVKLATPDFSKTSCTSGCEETTVGIYQAKDEDGMSYYYRGDVENNYVKFANKWWRIIRINGDGSIRLIYDGTSAHQNGESTTDSIAIVSQVFNNDDDVAKVGFKYTVGEVHGLETKSNALIELEKWYTNNLLSYANKIELNEGFCGDRVQYKFDKENWQYILGTDVETYFGGIARDHVKKWNLKCQNSLDLYTVANSTKGNKSLIYPIGLITVDEIGMAGATSENNKYYLYNGQRFYTISPAYVKKILTMENSYYVNNYAVWENGGIATPHIDFELGLRPVINIRSDVKITGNGTISNPYIVS